MALKRTILLAALLVVVSQTGLQAQERGPLVMQVEFEWTVVGAIAGVTVGFLLWLTDPANPGNNLADSIAAGAAWGSFAGAGFGVFVLQTATIYPGVAVINPLAPQNRISADPVAVLSREPYMLASHQTASLERTLWQVPLLSLRF